MYMFSCGRLVYKNNQPTISNFFLDIIFLSFVFFFTLQCSYNVENAEFAIKKMAQTTMRSEIGKITLDTVFRERETLNVNIVGKIPYNCSS